MLINNAVITGSFIVNGVDVTGITGSSNVSSSYLALSASFLVTSASYAITSASYASASGSLSTRVTNLEATSSTVSSSFATTSGSLSTRVTNLESTSSVVSSSFATTSGSIAGRVTLIEGQYATTGSNNFTKPQQISDVSNAISFTSTASLYTDGGLRVKGSSFISGTAYFNDVVVYGTSSIEYITSSQLAIGTNIITLNTDTPSIRFGGISVFDSGSNNLSTGSLFWDSEKDKWIYSNPSASTYDGGMLISGPRNTSGLGNEVGTTSCALMMGQGGDHITSSAIFSYGNATCFYGQSFISSSGAACFSNGLTTTNIVLTGSLNLTSFICSSGNLRIDKDQPDIQLNITCATQYSRIYFLQGASGNGGVQLIGSEFTGTRKCRFEIFGSSAGIAFIANGVFESPGMFITGSSVGIGTITPAYTLDVNGTGGFCGNINISRNANTLTRLITSNTTAGTSAYVETTFISDTSSGASAIGKYSSATNTYKIITASNTFLYNNTVAGDIAILNDFASGAIKMAAGGSCTSHLTIASTGAATFSSTLSATTAYFSGNVIVDNQSLNSPKYLQFDANISSGANASLGDIRWYNKQWDASIKAQIVALTDTDITNGRLSFRTGTDGVNAIERLRISSTGLATFSSDIQGGGDLYFNKATRTTIYPTTTNQNLHIKSNGTGLLQFNDDVVGNIAMAVGGGSVGIGTSSPGARLDVCQLGGDSARTCHALYLRAGNNSDVFCSNQILFSYNGSTDYAHAIKTRHNSNNAIDNAFDFYTWRYGDAAATKAGQYVMTIAGNGRVGIGTCAPNAKFTVQNTDNSVFLSLLGNGGNSRLNVGTDSSSNVYLRSQNSVRLSLGVDATNNMEFTSTAYSIFYGRIDFGTDYTIQSASDKMSMGYQGTYGWIQTWNSTPLYFNLSGNAVYAGTQRIDNNSDQRLKQNIEPINNALETVLNLQGRKFNMLDENCILRYGFVAQEVSPHLNDFVCVSERRYKKDGLEIENLLTLENSGTAWGALLVEAIKQQQCTINTLKTCLGIS